MARLDRLNARVGARRPLLLGAPGLRELLTRPSTEARVELLRTRPAGAGLPADAALPPVALARVEAGLRAAAREEAERLAGLAEGRRARALLAAFLALDEAAAVKAVLRGVALGAPIDATVAAAPAVTPPGPEALRAAAAAPALADAVAVLEAAGSAVAAAVRPALAQVAKAGLAPLERAADRAGLARARAACRRRGEDGEILARHLSDRTDARNAETLLTLDGAAPEPGTWLEGGRRWDAAALDALARAGPPAARRAVAAGFGLPEAALASPWAAERALEAALVAPLRREARQRPLSIAVPLRHLLERRAEVARVAVLLRGAAVGIAGDELLDLVEA
ncbi:V-type ATPase subunit [Anaeromyxobacter sp. Red801]|uniref:V-type ATPase subunit n=1 Tax=Anaeromyxobacter sp. Red801 TaxID=3411632 RepID=UPI003BA3D675